MSRKKTGRVLSTLFPKAKLHNHNTIDALNQREINGSISTKYFPGVWGIFICFILVEEDSHFYKVASNKFVLVGVQSPTKINAPRGCTAILLGKCQQS